MGGMEEDPPMPAFNATGDEPMSYALFPENKGYLYTHVVFMVIAFWVLMPLGIMFGIGRSSLHVPVQILTFIVALFGYFFGKLYGHSVPHLYAGNVHHSMGWIIFLLMIAQLSVGVVRKIANAVGRSQQDAAAHYDRLESVHLVNRSASSSSSDHHSEHSEETLHNNSHSSDGDGFRYDKEEEDEDNIAMSPIDLEEEDPVMMRHNEKPSLINRLFDKLLPYIPNIVKKVFVATAYNPFTNVVCRYWHTIVGRVFVILIFTQTLSGLVVYHGVCRSWTVLGCIAHLIKGGIFFFYGILTFARYLGAFAEQGWAWNRVDGGAKFSFEMIESFLIFIYGITNTWMEHFGQNPEWTHKDLEHASLAFMWWWCGLLGIIVESRALRRLLERNILNTPLDVPRHEPQQSYSMNPFPGLIVLFTGISMGNHHQDTIYSTNIHYFWGMLLALAAMCRFLTYITLYRAPPMSNQPTRPPSEAIGAFLLIAGSILFMASNSGTLTWLRRNNVDMMFMMNVCVALSSMTLCYVFFMFAMKAWSMKREQKKKAKLHRNFGLPDHHHHDNHHHQAHA
ncbi:hypothetical protein BDB00DRAFT_884543 [Zychaea mexicana]|uniref:uncharacterized protein n=1 Tax=Zychaea mexicana TaxID=64656 RepID=UPI0022FDBFCE|nr:uncharacterized protein BDB00DRAFT_884543 [Zychaea mexicana]KAI9489278.1 hypothetical protein BDB00DRAFT_884543 [Zychaea mexicana]